MHKISVPVSIEQRECYKRNGDPKKQFSNRAAAEAQAAKQSGADVYHAYQCRHGHWHVGHPKLPRVDA